MGSSGGGFGPSSGGLGGSSAAAGGGGSKAGLPRKGMQLGSKAKGASSLLENLAKEEGVATLDEPTRAVAAGGPAGTHVISGGGGGWTHGPGSTRGLGGVVTLKGVLRTAPSGGLRCGRGLSCSPGFRGRGVVACVGCWGRHLVLRSLMGHVVAS